MRPRHRLGVYRLYQQKFRFGRSAWTRLLWEIGVRQWPVFIIHVSKEVVPAWAPLHPLRQWFAMSLNIPHRGHFTYHGHFGWPKNFFVFLFNVVVFLSSHLVHHQIQQVQSWYKGHFKIKILWWAPSGTYILGQKGLFWRFLGPNSAPQCRRDPQLWQHSFIVITNDLLKKK